VPATGLDSRIGTWLGQSQRYRKVYFHVSGAHPLRPSDQADVDDESVADLD
jgi:hypothetical protein